MKSQFPPLKRRECTSQRQTRMFITVLTTWVPNWKELQDLSVVEGIPFFWVYSCSRVPPSRGKDRLNANNFTNVMQKQPGTRVHVVVLGFHFSDVARMQKSPMSGGGCLWPGPHCLLWCGLSVSWTRWSHTVFIQINSLRRSHLSSTPPFSLGRRAVFAASTHVPPSNLPFDGTGLWSVKLACYIANS